MGATLVAMTAIGLAVSCAAAGASALDRLPIVLAGAHVREGARTISRDVNLPSMGVWYVWLKATNEAEEPAVLTWDLNGEQPLHSARSQVVIKAHTESQWVSRTRSAAGPGFKMQVHVEEPGAHTLNLTLVSGEVRIEKIALTLYFSAKPDGDTLDHSGDPGGGRAEFPVAVPLADGFRSDWQSPPTEVTGTAYYVDSVDGDDDNDGLSEKAPWRTLAHVNGREFLPGDAILLKRGTQWQEGLAPKGSGTAEQWITIGAYAEGPRPYVNGGNRPGVGLRDQSYWVIQDLRVTNEPEQTEDGGIAVMASKGTPQPKGIRIHNCIVFDTGGTGIQVGSEFEKGGNGYDGVVIENCLCFANAGSGIEVNGNDQNGCRNSVIRHCTAYSNPGMAGIWIHSGQNGLIERCLGYNNACINIWTWNSINVTIRYCEAFRGRPPRDRGGFDIDWGCEACTIEYCYAHHNEGCGILLMGRGDKQYRGFPMQSRYNICRYCVSEEPIVVIETFEHCKVYNNVVVTSRDAAMDVHGWPIDGHDQGGWPADTEFFNNILISWGDGVPMWVDDYATRQNNGFDHNLFWRTDGEGTIVKWAGRKHGKGFWKGTKEGRIPPDEYDDLASFRETTGQEHHGLYADPMLQSPGAGGIGRLPLEVYKLLPGSPAIGAGRAVELSEEWLAGRRKYLTDTGAEAYGIPMEPEPARTDYWLGRLPLAGRVSIGVHEPQ
jgi:hypothetical protein